MNNTKHTATYKKHKDVTPTPWKIVKCTEKGFEKHVSIATEDEEDYPLENDLGVDRVATSKADCEHIVHCVNTAEAKDKRIAELEGALSEIRSRAIYGTTTHELANEALANKGANQ